MKSPYTQININSNGVPPGDLKKVVSASYNQLVIWFFDNKTQDDAYVKLDNWVTDKTTNPKPYPGSVVAWLTADPITGEMLVPAKSRAPLIGLVEVSANAFLLLSADLTVTINGNSTTYDPDLEVSPPGTIIFDYTTTLFEFIKSQSHGSTAKKTPNEKNKGKKKGRK
jgi:hypothetical protein